MTAFHIVSSADADIKKYDACIAADDTSTPFAESWYMDITAGSWFIVTDANYSTVFPFAVRRKFGIQYIYQPFFNRCTGIFGSNRKELLSAIQNGLLNNYKLWDFYADNSLTGTDAAFHPRKYQVLELNNNYDIIHENYSTKLRRSLRLAEKDDVNVRTSVNLQNFSGEFRKHTGDLIHEFNDADYVTLQKLTEAAIKRKEGLLLEAVHNNTITASALFYANNNCILYIEGYSTPEGRDLRSMHVLFDHVIKMYAGQRRKLDFGGSNLETVARFFHSFGAKDASYHHIYRNRLPALVNWLKKIRQ